MGFTENEKYEATVTQAAFIVSAEKGTGGLAIVFSTSEGPLDRTWWVTENTIPYLKKTLGECFGVTDSQLTSDEFIEGGVGAFLKGKPCSVVPELAKDGNGNVYKDANGKTYFTVKWLNPSRLGKKATGQSVKKIASLFGGGSSSHDDGPPPAQWGGEEDGAAF